MGDLIEPVVLLPYDIGVFILIYVAYTDSTETTVSTLFSCAQDKTGYPYQGTIEDSDPRYLAFVNPASTLTGAQEVQTATVSAACEAAITAGISSAALGTAHTYPSALTDQQNLDASVTDALCAKADPVWSGSTAVDAGAINVISDVPCLCVVGGTTGTTAPSLPTSTTTIIDDGTAQWQLWSTMFWCEDSSGTWAWASHSAAQIVQAGRDIKAVIMAYRTKNATLAAQIAAATTVADVEAITWS